MVHMFGDVCTILFSRLFMVTDDSFDLGTNQPYFAMKLTAEEAKLIEGKEIILYEIEGKSIFEVRNNGQPTDERVMFILFK